MPKITTFCDISVNFNYKYILNSFTATNMLKWRRTINERGL